MRAGSRREIQKGKRSLFITAYYPVKNTQPATFFDFDLTFSEASNKILYARRRKFILGLKIRISFGEIGNLYVIGHEWNEINMYTFVSVSQAVEILCTK